MQSTQSSQHYSSNKPLDPVNSQPFYPKSKTHSQQNQYQSSSSISTNAYQGNSNHNSANGNSAHSTNNSIQKPQQKGGMIQTSMVYQQYNQINDNKKYKKQSRGGQRQRKMVEMGDPDNQQEIIDASRQEQSSIVKILEKAQGQLSDDEEFIKVFKKIEKYLELQLQIFKNSDILKTNIESLNFARRISGWLLLYMGDLSRYKAKCENQDKDVVGKAKTLYPFEGKIFNQLAERGFTNSKTALRGLNNRKVRDDKVFYDFILAFFRFQGILYTRIGIDELELLEPEVSQLFNEYFISIDKEANKIEEIDKIIHLSIIMIFIAHATIADTIKDLQKQGRKNQNSMRDEVDQKQSARQELEKALSHQLPQFAIKQITQLLLLIIDRISSLPSFWLEALTPILTWMTLHKDDQLLSTIFETNPQIVQDLSRIHKLLSNYVHLELKSIKDEEEQLQITQFIGSTLLKEEFFFIGFLPLQSYLDHKKQVGCGEKCPQQREYLVRSLILKDHLELIKCTFEDLKHNSSSSSDEKNDSSEEIKESEDFFSQIDQISRVNQRVDQKPMIIVDAQNSAMRHGGSKFFSVLGVQIVIEYWHKNGHQVVCFLPDYLFNYDQVNTKKKLASMNLKNVKVSQIPDNVSLLHSLADKGFIVKTPPQDYDDSYCIQYAKKFNAFIVTNDKFRDYILKQENNPDKSKERKWIKDHSISYTFNGNEFLPNPDSKIFVRYPYEDYHHFPLDKM
ncbi:UNKNOWN [Stylonychia lemnae]|uniref:RNase NYN domain-containing protein n=1 Tax=Stylonychia lemnae TaxID=5949 RepID=A0A078B199_STYLE|nr:UNKNOWN [Stylonychia lemnae]|eukprot:CDW86913.1 UNKNOWN [Stylonychia lemnae]